MIIEVFAFETSGLDPKKDILLEAACLRVDLKTGAVLQRECGVLNPGEHDFSPEILEIHGKSGLLAELMHAPKISIDDVQGWAGPANMRVLWARDFIAPFLPYALPANTFNASEICKLAGVLHDVNYFPAFSRAAAKTELTIAALRALA